MHPRLPAIHPVSRAARAPRPASAAHEPSGGRGKLPRASLLIVAVLGAACGGGGRDEAPSKAPPLALSPAEALREAALSGRLRAVRAALEQGAAVEAADKNGRTPLMLAALMGHTEVVRLLLARGAGVEARDAAGRTALMYAASGPNEPAVRLLLEHGAEVDATDGGEGWTALMFAAAEGHAEVVKTLLAHGARVEIRDADGDRAVEFAKARGQDRVVRLLTEALAGDR